MLSLAFAWEDADEAAVESAAEEDEDEDEDEDDMAVNNKTMLQSLAAHRANTIMKLK